MGFGRPLDEFPMLLQPGVLSIAWGTAIRQLAAGLGIEVDEITESYQREPAPEDFDIAVGHVAKGTVAALQFEIHGMVNGHPAIVIEHVTRLRPDLRPDWAQPAQAAARTGSRSPASRPTPWTSFPTSRNGDHNQAAICGAAGRIVNAIPAVVAARARHQDDPRPAVGHRKRAVRTRARRSELDARNLLSRGIFRRLEYVCRLCGIVRGSGRNPEVLPETANEIRFPLSQLKERGR